MSEWTEEVLVKVAVACKAKAEESVHTQDAGTVTKEPTRTETGIDSYTRYDKTYDAGRLLKPPITGWNSGWRLKL